MSDAEALSEPIAATARPKIFDWIWHPLRAKLWWAAVSLYWGGMLISLHSDTLAGFYHSAAAGFANMLFFPPLVALILSFGYIKASLERSDPSIYAENADAFNWPGARYGPFGRLRELDPLDSASGSNWIGSPLNPSHPFYVIRHRHSS